MQKAKNQKRGPGKAADRKAALSAQQTIPYLVMHPDGVCQLPGGLYTKTVEYEDINYSVASTEDQTAIFGGWSSFLNYFDTSLPFQLSFINRRSRSRSKYRVNIPQAEDSFNSIRAEFTGMLKNQIARSNNGIERSKYITFGLPADGIGEARPRLERVEADVTGNLKRLGVPSEPLDGRSRLALLHSQRPPGNREPFRFSWQDIPKTGLGTKDYIAPDSFDFRQSRLFRVGQYWGAASYLQIMASELSDKLLAEILELDAELTVTMEESGFAVKRGRGGVISFLAPGQDKPTRLRSSTLGPGFDPEDIRAVIAGERPIPELPKEGPPPPRRVDLIIDIQNRLAQGKGPAYERWAKVYNLKQMAAALLYLREHGLTDYAALEATTEAAVDRFHSLAGELRDTEAALSHTSQLMGAVVKYAKTRPVFDGYKAARYSKKYLAQHEAELADYRAAKATMSDLLGGAKLPKMDALKKERRELSEKKKALYAEYRKAQADMRQAVAVKANIDHLLGVTDGRENKAQER